MDKVKALIVLYKIKAHVERNKKIYIVGSYVVVAGVTIVVTKRVMTYQGMVKTLKPLVD